jgi:uncharacterized protein (TIGR02444 family)
LQDLDTPFWDFSLTVYGGDGVEDECLDLQERLTLDVNLLLFAAYTGAVEGLLLDSQDIAAVNSAIAGWHGDVVRALRRARHALKPASTDANNPLQEASSTLRSQVKIIELQAERIEQAILWQWSRVALAGRPRIDRTQALAANLGGVLAFYGAAAGATAPRLRAAAAGYVA